MIAIWVTYLLAAVAASGIFIAAGWRSKHGRGRAVSWKQDCPPVDHLWGESEADIEAPEAQADVGAAIRLVLKRLAPLMAGQSVKAEIACSFGLAVRMRSAVLVDLLEELVTAAIHGAPASTLLITATTHGDRIYVGITDDMPGADPAVRQGGVRGLAERVAMRGGALDVNVRPSEGTTMTLRLAAAAGTDLADANHPESDRPESGRPDSGRPQPEPAAKVSAASPVSVRAEL